MQSFKIKSIYLEIDIYELQIQKVFRKFYVSYII
jgi:hypothetical protein